MLPFLYRQKRPNKHLRSYIANYWRFRRTFGPGKTQTIFPDSKYELMWVARGTLFVNGNEVPRLFVGGMSPAPIQISAPGMVEIWSVRFMPWGLSPFGSLTAVQDTPLPAELVFGAAATTELQALFETATPKTLFADLDTYFLRNMMSRRVESATLQVATRYLEARKGNVKVQDLADHCNLSSRQLERVISKATGKTPRDIASRLRFEHVRNAMWRNPDISTASLASEFGYVDQSHLHKDFRHYTNLTPAEYLRQINEIYGHLREVRES